MDHGQVRIESMPTQDRTPDRSIAGYPEADRLDLTEEIHACQVSDPYRWLEDLDDPRTQRWCAQQDDLFARHRASWLGDGASERLRRRLSALADAGSVSVPVWRGRRCFFTRRGPNQEHEVLLAVDTADPDGPDGTGPERMLIDPAAIDPSGSTTLDAWFPSQEGDLLAYLLSAGGTEQSLLRVMDLATGETVDGPIDRASHSVVAWLPGGAAFYYRRQPPPEQVPDGDERYSKRVYLHRIGTDPDVDVLVFGAGLPHLAYPGPVVSRDGRWLCLQLDWGPLRLDSYLADLSAGGIEAPPLTALQEGVDAISAPRFGRDGRIYVHTDRDAGNGRLCVVDPQHLGYQHWRTVLPEDPEAMLKDFMILNGPQLDRSLVLALWSRHALSELTLHDLATGELVAPVATPGLGTIRELAAHPDGGPLAWFSYTDFRTSPGVCRFDARTGEVAEWPPSPSRARQPDRTPQPGRTPRPRAVEVRRDTYTSRDGTTVGMFILSPAGEPDRPRPAILYGYGAFGSSRSPAFDAFRISWVEAGGVYAIANVRGGGEEGNAWHRAGMRENKQNTFDDFQAAADYLVDQGWTTRAQLGLHGGSAGGHLVAVALTQRPGACAAVLCSAPPLDMVRYERFPPAAWWAREYGSAHDPEEFGWLLAGSPYHHVRPGAAYPAVLLSVFEGDARVNPLHARKFTAALQHATSGTLAERPILLRREQGAGHTKRAVTRSISLWLDQLGFFARHLGLELSQVSTQLSI
jgi:prolyl oligopeptidase